MIAMANQAKGLNAAFDEYQKDHPNVNLDIVVANTVTDFETMMTTYIAANELPDMYLNQVGAVQQSYAAEGYLMPITDIGVMDKIIDNVAINILFFKDARNSESVKFSIHGSTVKLCG